MASPKVLITNPDIFPQCATKDGLLIAGGKTVEALASALIPEIEETNFVVVTKPEKTKPANKPEATPETTPAEAGEN